MIVWRIVTNTWHLFLEAAPWLLVGLAAAALIKAWIPEDAMADWLGGHGLWTVTKAACVGAPLPLCSCGVVPTALGLHRNGASRASTAAFLIATPETGADSVGASYALLGPFLTVVRPVTAVASGILTGLTTRLAPAAGPSATPTEDDACGEACGSDAQAATASDACDDGREEGCADTCSTGRPPAQEEACCSESPAEAASSACASEACGDDCCSGDAAAPNPASWGERTRAGIHYAITEVLDDFSLWLLVGLIVAGATVTFVPPSALATYGRGLPAMLAVMALSVPIYVCATESTPIATALLAAGVAPGTVLVFLLAGPATNLGTVGALHEEFGDRFVAVYLAGIGACALTFGLLTNALVEAWNVHPAAHLQAASGLVPGWVALGSALVLLVLAVPPLRTPLLRRLA